jgi:hypothetical protein
MTSRSFDFVPDVLPGDARYAGPQLEDPASAFSVSVPHICHRLTMLVLTAGDHH